MVRAATGRERVWRPKPLLKSSGTERRVSQLRRGDCENCM